MAFDYIRNLFGLDEDDEDDRAPGVARSSGPLRGDAGPELPDDITVEDEDTPIDQAERDLLFPRGIPDEKHRGALGDLAARSAAADAATQQLPQEKAEAAHAAPEPVTTRHAPKSSLWMTAAPKEQAEAAQSQRNKTASASIGHSVGTIVRMAATAYAGGAAGGGGGGAAPGSAAGASSGAAGAGGAAGFTAAEGATGAAPIAGSGASAATPSFGSSLMEGYKSGGGQGTGGFLGRLAKNYVNDKSYGQSGSGGGQAAKSIEGQLKTLAMTSGREDKRRATLARLGVGEFDPGMVQTPGGERFWFMGGG